MRTDCTNVLANSARQINAEGGKQWNSKVRVRRHDYSYRIPPELEPMQPGAAEPQMKVF